MIDMLISTSRNVKNKYFSEIPQPTDQHNEQDTNDNLFTVTNFYEWFSQGNKLLTSCAGLDVLSL
jgi:hypothetical protein